MFWALTQNTFMQSLNFYIPARSSTYRQVFVKMMLVRDLFCRLTTRHHKNHYVVPHFPILIDNPQHIMLVLLLILQHCNFYIFLVNNLFEKVFSGFFCFKCVKGVKLLLLILKGIKKEKNCEKVFMFVV